MKVCVSCQADVEGRPAVPVREDRIIRAIRAFKRLLNIAQMNELYVCNACMKQHTERRKAFEKTMLFASVIAGLMLVVIILAPLLSGRFDVIAILSGFVVAGFILVLPIFKYAPAVEGGSKAPEISVAPPAPQAAPEQAAGDKKKRRRRRKAQ